MNANRSRHTLAAACALLLSVCTQSSVAQDRLERIQYNNPGLVVDLGVGLWAWPLPMDYDRDGDLDLVVSCPDKPYNGTYFFENPTPKPVDGNPRDPSTLDPRPSTLPVFKPSVRIAHGPSNVQVSYIDGEPVVMTPGKIYVDFREHQFANPIELPLPAKIDPQYKRIRANQWKLVDWEADGDLDVIVGIGVWDDYGWDDAWDENGNWTNGPLHGFVYLIENLAITKGERRGVSPPMSPDNKPPTPLPDDTPWPDLLGPRPIFAQPVKLTTNDGNPIDVYGMPSPNLADFDGDGDLDLICGEFLDGFTWFENGGERGLPIFADGVRLTYLPQTEEERKWHEMVKETRDVMRLDLQMITPVAVDWDADGDIDLISGDEDGRVAVLENRDKVEQRQPVFHGRRYFKQEAGDVKFGALVTPHSTDWDADGDEDLVCGNTAGYLGVIENLGFRDDTPSWDEPAIIALFEPQSAHILRPRPLRHQAGRSGSIQGPCEAKWGYTAPYVADWDNDDFVDLIVNDIWGKVVWYRNYEELLHRDPLNGPARTHRLANPIFEKHYPVVVAWTEDPKGPAWNWWTPDDGELVTQWRTTPCVLDWNKDGLNDLVMLDHEGYLACFERSKDAGLANADSLPNDSEPDESTLPWADFRVLPPKRIFKIHGPCEFDARHRPVGDKQDGLLRLNANRAGASGRRKLHFVDWDGDGLLDLLVNSVNVNFLRNVGADDEGFTWFSDEGPLDDRVLAGHTTSPTTVDWDANGIPDLLVGAEDGYLYYKQNPRAKDQGEPNAQINPNAHGSQPVGLNALDELPPGVLSREFIYQDAPFPECHAATIEETPAGLVAAWFGGTREGDKDVGIWVSMHSRGQWTEPEEVADGVQHATLRYPCWNPVLFQQPDGPLQLYYKCGPSPSTWWGMLTESEDHGESWSWPRRLPETILGPVKNKPVLLENGELLCGSSTEHDGWTVHFEITPDAGRTWERIGPINSGEEFNAIQPTILQHADGRLQILCRSKEQRITTSWSEDNGRTWSKMTETELPNPNSGVDAVTLDDGRHLLVYNHTRRSAGEPRGRSLLNVAVSEDGENWHAAIVLENEPGEFSYPAVIQSADGLVHVLYTWKRERIRHVVVDPSQLELEPISDGVWPGLPQAGQPE